MNKAHRKTLELAKRFDAMVEEDCSKKDAETTITKAEFDRQLTVLMNSLKGVDPKVAAGAVEQFVNVMRPKIKG